MNDAFLIAAGVLGAAIAIAHGFIGETKIVASANWPSLAAKRVISAIMFLSAVYWFLAGAVLIATPFALPDAARSTVVLIVAAVFLSGCLGNLWATRGRHFGWALLAIATALTLLGR